MVFSRMKQSLLARLFGGVTFAVFLGWFVLPSCHCQWDLVFGNESGQVENVDSIILDGATSPGQPCHCDDCPAKTFEAADETQLRAGFQFPAVPVNGSFLNDLSGDPVGDVLARGPPPEFLGLHHSESRTYLRQLSFRL